MQGFFSSPCVVTLSALIYPHSNTLSFENNSALHSTSRHFDLKTLAFVNKKNKKESSGECCLSLLSQAALRIRVYLRSFSQPGLSEIPLGRIRHDSPWISTHARCSCMFMRRAGSGTVCSLSRCQGYAQNSQESPICWALFSIRFALRGGCAIQTSLN